MKLAEVVNQLKLEEIIESVDLDREVTGGYCSDLLSNVMGQAKSGELWITLQTHQNIVAVASLVELSGIIIACGAELDTETIAKAKKEDIPLFTTDLSIYEVAGRLYKLGV
ncbi:MULTISPECIES: DRTGG domain-containing protein [unclassified Candidatus Frackibacter]|uniref:DRTGG domain-containing protein n=1 Tax=unclassified Candidatus Frackibacter TaxID=2648818 RepID=UPI000795F735|nr:MULTISPECIES: DRTGG domain-containing protein [unclassified Candidatus Frackibacter]KXS36730.1 MAG: HPr kinase [Candidatus Frackibacter sp. T328-2]SDC41898.1 DRTGG domain-containing protein [Candidatus Frackibacter sp. WG11]SEM59147.1 DRTGG domain-containing protein [Candidatus Frackibacter sp. WG12]SFL62963.1 DRTGG domain-containing protein [Candidatus Frackibacter sp. WG13]